MGSEMCIRDRYMYFKMDKDQRILAEQILDLAFYPDLAQHDDTDKASHELLQEGTR